MSRSGAAQLSWSSRTGSRASVTSAVGAAATTPATSAAPTVATPSDQARPSAPATARSWPAASAAPTTAPSAAPEAATIAERSEQRAEHGPPRGADGDQRRELDAPLGRVEVRRDEETERGHGPHDRVRDAAVARERLLRLAIGDVAAVAANHGRADGRARESRLGVARRDARAEGQPELVHALGGRERACRRERHEERDVLGARGRRHDALHLELTAVDDDARGVSEATRELGPEGHRAGLLGGRRDHTRLHPDDGDPGARDLAVHDQPPLNRPRDRSRARPARPPRRPPGARLRRARTARAHQPRCRAAPP